MGGAKGAAICSRWLPHRALRLPLYSPSPVKPSLLVSVRVTPCALRPLSLPHTFNLPHCTPTRPLVPPSGRPLFYSHLGTYQRQGNLICPAVRRTLTELNVWFPFIRVHLRTAAPPALHIPPRHQPASFALSFRSIFQLKLDRVAREIRSPLPPPAPHTPLRLGLTCVSTSRPPHPLPSADLVK